MRQTEKLKQVHDEAVMNFARIQEAYFHERMQCLADRRFYSIAGAQWEGHVGEQFANRPKFEINKVHLAVIKIFNEYRNNRVTVKFVSKDGDPTDELTDVCNGLYRADEIDSVAEEAYDNAFEEAVGGGFGAIRLITEYEDEADEENDKQRIRIEPIYDADSSVFFDIDAKRQDKSDARYCFVMHSMTKQAFHEEYGEEEAASSVPKEVDQSMYDWYSPDLVYIAEYYKIEEEKQTLYIYRTLLDKEERYTESELTPELEAELEEGGARLDRKRDIKVHRVHKYIISGNSVLEDCGFLAGKHIPIIPNYGKRWFVESVERCMGHVRLARDMQIIKNILMSKYAETAALSSTEKPILFPEQVAGHEELWAMDNVSQFPYLLVNPMEDAQGQIIATGPIGYTKLPEVAPAQAQLMALADVDMRELLGNSAEADKMLSHVSGKAHELIQRRIDGQAYIYMSNFAKTVRRVGEVWLSMARDVYVEAGRKMKTVDPLGKTSSVTLAEPGVSSSGAVGLTNDLTKATFDVTVDVGPSSASQRQAAVQALTGILGVSQDQQTHSLLEALILYNMEGEGLNEAREYFRKRLVDLGVFTPTPEEAEEMAKTKQPSPQDQALLGMAAESNAKAQKTMAEIQKIISEIELNAAKTAQTMSDVDMQNLQKVKLAIDAEQASIEAQQQRIQMALRAVGAGSPQGGANTPGVM